MHFCDLTDDIGRRREAAVKEGDSASTLKYDGGTTRALEMVYFRRLAPGPSNHQSTALRHLGCASPAPPIPVLLQICPWPLACAMGNEGPTWD